MITWPMLALITTMVLATIALLAIGALVSGPGRRVLLLFALLVLYVATVVPLLNALDRTQHTSQEEGEPRCLSSRR
jgi:uncharacterized membrane protein